MRCREGHITVPPRHTCGVCGRSDLAITQLNGWGKVVSYTVVNTKSESFPLDVPYTLAFVKLDEGGNLLGIILNDNTSGAILSSRVKVIFKTLNKASTEFPRIFFRIKRRAMREKIPKRQGVRRRR